MGNQKIIKAFVEKFLPMPSLPAFIFTLFFLAIFPQNNFSIIKSPVKIFTAYVPTFLSSNTGFLVKPESYTPISLTNLTVSSLITSLFNDLVNNFESTQNQNNFILSPKNYTLSGKNYIRISNMIGNDPSLFNAVVTNNSKTPAIIELINSMNKLNLKKTDINHFDILLEGNFIEPNKLEGKIIYAHIRTTYKEIKFYKHKFKNGTSRLITENYFNQNKPPSFLARPVDSTVPISSKFGMRKDPIYHRYKFHRGVDFAVKHGTPIKASFAGTIEYIGIRGGYGKYIKIKHVNGYSTAYAHLSQYNTSLHVGSLVNKGDIIAYSGNTGKSTGPHLHFEVIHRGKHVDPLKSYIPEPTLPINVEEKNSFNVTLKDIQRQLYLTHPINQLANL